MKDIKIILKLIPFIIVILFMYSSCVTAIGVSQIGDDLSANIGESEIIINGPGGYFYTNADLTISLNDEIVCIIRGNGFARFIVPNGQHTLSVRFQGTGARTTFPTKAEPFKFTINSQIMKFGIRVPFTVFGKVRIRLLDSNPLADFTSHNER